MPKSDDESKALIQKAVCEDMGDKEGMQFLSNLSRENQFEIVRRVRRGEEPCGVIDDIQEEAGRKRR